MILVRHVTKVEFVLLADNAQAEDLNRHVGDCVQTAYSNGGMYIHTETHQETRVLDEYLWTLGRAEEFAPHEVIETLPDTSLVGSSHSPIVIGASGEPDGSHRTLLNLSNQVPWFFCRFEKLIELVRPGINDRKMGRERYLYYKHRGYQLQHRQL